MFKICPAAYLHGSWIGLAALSVCLSMLAGVVAAMYAGLVNGTDAGEAIRIGIKFGSVVLAPMVAAVFATAARRPRV